VTKLKDKQTEHHRISNHSPMMTHNSWPQQHMESTIS